MNMLSSELEGAVGFDVHTSCLLSVVVPVYNEEGVLPLFHRRLSAVLDRVPGRCEVIYVDDGSTDSTAQLLAVLHEEDVRVGVANLSRNFGKEHALSAGLRLTRGAAVVVIDVDLQDPPELIPEMLATWREGFDMVNMRRRRRDGETWFKRATAHLFYRVINRLGEVEIPENVGDFRLLSRRAVDAVNALTERNRFMKGLFAWVGYRQTVIDYDRAPRAAGNSKWPYGKLWCLAMEGITAFSAAPLRVATYVGLFSAFGAFVYALFFLGRTALFGDPVRGFPTLIVALLFLGGLQLMATGVLGEYLGRLFNESKQRPLYLLDQFQMPMQFDALPVAGLAGEVLSR